MNRNGLRTVEPKPVPTSTGRIVPEEIIEKLEDLLEPMHVGPTTTELEAGFRLGANAVLRMLRRGI